MFDASSELLDDADLPSLKQWESHDAHDASHSHVTGDPHATVPSYPAAVALLERTKRLGSDIAAEDAEDIRALREQLQEAIAKDDETEVASLCEELDDILFYVQ